MVEVYAALMIAAVLFAAAAAAPPAVRHPVGQRILLVTAGVCAGLAIIGMSYEGGMVWVGK